MNYEKRCDDLLEVFNELIPQIGEWSQYNFGDQKGANALAPLAGVNEEYLKEYLLADEIDDEIDAVSDILIFLADLLYRSGLKSLSKKPFLIDQDPEEILGDLNHIILKRLQGIRGYADDEYFFTRLRKVVSDFITTLVINSNFNVARELRKTWEKVSKRDWKKNSVTGGQ